MIFTIILVCLTIIAIAGGCIWEIEKIELNKLKPYENNAKLHTKEQK